MIPYSLWVKSEVLSRADKGSPPRTGSHLLHQPPASFPAPACPLPSFSVSLCFTLQELAVICHFMLMVYFYIVFLYVFSQVFPCFLGPAPPFFHLTNIYFKTKLCVLYSFQLLSFIHCMALYNC